MVVAFGNVSSIIAPYQDLPIAALCLWLLRIIHVLLDDMPPPWQMDPLPRCTWLGLPYHMMFSAADVLLWSVIRVGIMCVLIVLACLQLLLATTATRSEIIRSSPGGSPIM